MDLRLKIREVVDFPKPGVNFKDITTLVKDGEALRHVVKTLADLYRDRDIDLIVGVESRGFVIGAPLAYELGIGFIVVRKPGKLPAPTERIEYDLEYGSDALEIHKDAIQPGQRVLVVDDLLATGGTIAATAVLCERLQADLVGFAFLVELAFLGGRKKLIGRDVFSLVAYDS